MTDLEFITDEIANLEQSLAHAAKMNLKYPALEKRLEHLKRIKIKLKLYERWKDQIKDKYKNDNNGSSNKRSTEMDLQDVIKMLEDRCKDLEAILKNNNKIIEELKQQKAAGIKELADIDESIECLEQQNLAIAKDIKTTLHTIAQLKEVA